MPAAQYDLEITAGGTTQFVVSVVGGPVDLAGYTGSMQIRSQREDPTPLAEVPAESIIINAATRQVQVRIPGSLTSAFDWRRGVYDLRIDGPEGTWFLVEGRVSSQLAITRED